MRSLVNHLPSAEVLNALPVGDSALAALQHEDTARVDAEASFYSDVVNLVEKCSGQGFAPILEFVTVSRQGSGDSPGDLLPTGVGGNNLRGVTNDSGAGGGVAKVPVAVASAVMFVATLLSCELIIWGN
jgi:hypothetical protein